MRNPFLVGMYLAAIVLANLVIAWKGPVAAVGVAFVCIGLDLTARDALHDAWKGRGLVWKMGLLIAVGSILSWALNRNAGPVALASFAAFASAACCDAVVYGLLGDRRRLVRINGSNVISAAVDSVVFPTLAFGQLLPWIIAGQFLAKVGGGAMWSVVLAPFFRKEKKIEYHSE